ncbi:autotransporter outer membrane beta-barrel domain-containing protein [Thorsellia kenyensis]|uniref:Autotransporter outer membrane beta-barrel domain-containing protein n=1 Tax=Thorsellia kenyensis TaxID=1549888 RepID=A0ABV6CDU9_9GAMM
MKLNKIAQFIKSQVTSKNSFKSNFHGSLSERGMNNTSLTKVGLLTGILLATALPMGANAITAQDCLVESNCTVVSNSTQLSNALSTTGSATRIVLANDITLNADINVRMIESGRKNIVIDGNGFSLNTGLFDFNINGNTSSVWGEELGSFKFENINELTSSTASDTWVINVGQFTGVNVIFDDIKRFTDSMYAVMGQQGSNINGNRIAEVVFGNIEKMDKFTLKIGHQIVEGGPLRFTGDFSVFSDGAAGEFNTIFWSNSPNEFNVMNFESNANFSAQVTFLTLGSIANNDAYKYIMQDGAKIKLLTPQNIFGLVNNGLKIGSYDPNKGFGAGVQLDIGNFQGGAVVGHGISNLGGDATGGLKNGAASNGDVIYNIASGSTLRYSGSDNAGIFVQKNKGVGGDVFVRSDAILQATNANGIKLNMNGTGQVLILNDTNSIINAKKGIDITSSGSGDPFNIYHLGTINSSIDGLSINTTVPRETNINMDGGIINAISGNAINILGQSNLNLNGGTINLSSGSTGLNVSTAGEVTISNLTLNNSNASSKSIVKSGSSVLNLLNSTLDISGTAKGLENIGSIKLSNTKINVSDFATGIDITTQDIANWIVENLVINVFGDGKGIVLASGQKIDQDISINIADNVTGSGLVITDGASEVTSIDSNLHISSGTGTAIRLTGTSNKTLNLNQSLSGNILLDNQNQSTLNINNALNGEVIANSGNLHTLNFGSNSDFLGNIKLNSGENNLLFNAGSSSEGNLVTGNLADSVILANGTLSHLNINLGQGDNSLILNENSTLLNSVLMGDEDDTIRLSSNASITGMIDLGAGNNQIFTNGKFNLTDLQTGSGDDSFVFSNLTADSYFNSLDAGDGSNLLNLTSQSNLVLSEEQKIINFSNINVEKNSQLTFANLNNTGNSLISLDGTSSLNLSNELFGTLNNSVAGQGRVNIYGDILVEKGNANFEGIWSIAQGAILSSSSDNVFGKLAFASIDNNGLLNLNNSSQLGYSLTGNGIVKINQNSLVPLDFAFTNNVGGAFTGIYELMNSRIVLNQNDNQIALANSNLNLSNNSVGIISANSKIGDLSLSGGELDFIFSGPTTSPVLTVNSLDITNQKLSRIDLAGNVNLDVSQLPDAPLAGNFLDQDSQVGNKGILLVKAGSVLDDGKQITLSVNGNATDTSKQFNGVSDGTNNDITAIYDYTAVTSNSSVSGSGIYVEYLLKELVSNSNIIFNSITSASKSLDALVSGVGGIEIIASNEEPLIITNENNSYSGETKLTAGSVRLGGNNVLGSTSLLNMGIGTKLEINGYSLSLNGLAGSGNVNIDSGELLIQNGQETVGTNFIGSFSGDTGSLIIAGGEFGITGEQTFTGTTLINQGAKFNLGFGVDNIVSYLGDIVNNGTVIFDSLRPIFYNGVVSGSGNVEIKDLTITEAQTYSGKTTIFEQLTLLNEGNLSGSVQLDKFAKLNFNNQSDLDFNNFIEGEGGISVNTNGRISLTNNNIFSGDTVINNGTLALTQSDAAGTSNISISTNGVLELNFDNMKFDNTLSSSGTVNVQGKSITFNADNTAFNGQLNILEEASLGVTSYNQIGASTVNLAGRLDLSQDENLIWANRLKGDGYLNVDLNKNMFTFSPASNEFTGTLALNNTYFDLSDLTNRSAIENGTLTLNSGSITESTVNGANIGNLNINGGELIISMINPTEANELNVKNLAVDPVNTGKLNLKGITLEVPEGVSGSTLLDQNTLDLSSGFIVVNAETVSTPGQFLDLFIEGLAVEPQEAVIKDDKGNDINATYKYISVAADNNFAEGIDAGLYVTYQLTKLESLTNLIIDSSNSVFNNLIAKVTGEGNLTLQGKNAIQISNANNDYTGQTLIEGTTVMLGANNALGKTSLVELKDGGSLNLSETSQTIGGLSGSGNFNIGKGELTINGTGQGNVFSGTLSGSSEGQFLLGGNLTLTGVNTFKGKTAIQETGVLTIGHDTSSSSYVSDIENNGQLSFKTNELNGITYENVISGSGNLDKYGAGTLILTNDNTFEGITNLFAGTIQLGNGGQTGSVKGNIFLDSDSSLLKINRSDNFELQNNLSGLGKLSQSGEGLITLTNVNNTFAGGIDIAEESGGISIDNNAKSAGTGAIQNNSLLKLNFSDQEFSNVISGVGVTEIVGNNITLNGQYDDFQGNWLIEGSAVINTLSSEPALGTGLVNLNGELRFNLADNLEKFTLSNRFEGEGLLDIFGGQNVEGLTELNILANKGHNFKGTIGLTDLKLTLNNTNNSFLSQANLQINSGTNLINDSYKAIGDLTLNGGIFTSVFANTTEAFLLTVNTLNLGDGANSGDVDIGTVNLDTTGIDTAISDKSFLDQNTADGDAIQLILANNVSQDGVMLDLLVNGLAVDTTTIDNLSDGFGNNDIGAEYSYEAVSSANAGANGKAGLFVDYVLKSLITKTDLVISTSNSTSKTLGALVQGAGNLNLRGDDGILTIANSLNSYEGNTVISHGGVKLGADNSLGKIGHVILEEMSYLDLGGYDQLINGLFTANGSTLDLNGGTLTYAGAADSSIEQIVNGNMKGAGVLNIQGGSVSINSENEDLSADINLNNDASLVLSGKSQIGSGILNISEMAKLELNGSSSLINNILSGNGTIDLNGSQVSLTENSESFEGLFNVDGKSRLTLNNLNNLGNATVNNLGTVAFDFVKALDQTLNANISGEGDLNKLGEGILRIKSDYSNLGSFNVENGFLILDSKDAMISALSITESGSAGGYGVIDGDVINEGILYVGDASGKTDLALQTLNIDGDLYNFNTISLAGSKAGNVLNVGGNYEARSDLVFNTVLDGDNSKTDKLNILGNTKGHTTVFVNNKGGRGSQTDKGIELISVTGESVGTFSLASRLVAGSYDYQLVKVDKNWFLQSDLRAIRPEIGAYLANIDITNANTIMTYHDRVNSIKSNAIKNEQPNNSELNIWGRIVGGVTDSQAANEIEQRFYHSYVQLGGDLIHLTTDQDNSYTAGVMGAIGQSHSSNTNSISRFVANTNQDNYRLGAYGTLEFSGLSQNQPAYLDTWMQVGWSKNEVRGQDLSGTEKYDSNNFASSLEFGYPINFYQQRNTYVDLVPEAQLTYKYLSADDFTESNGTVITHPTTDGIETRLGGKIKYSYNMANGTDFKSNVGLNWIHDNVNASVKLNDLIYYSDRPADILDINFGVSLDYKSRLSSHIDISSKHGSNGFEEISGRLGISYSF